MKGVENMKFDLRHFPEIRFRDTILRNVRETRKIVRTTENLSEYSALLLETDNYFFGALPGDAQRSLAWLLAIYIDLPEEFDYLRSLCLNKVLENAHKNNYEGKWDLILQIYDLEEDSTFSLTEIFYDVLQENMSDDEIFGNLVPLVRRYIKLFNRKDNENKLYYLQVRDPGKVVKTQRKRGYTDKGFTVLYNQRGSGTHLKEITVSGENPEKSYPKFKFPSSQPTTYMWLKERPR